METTSRKQTYFVDESQESHSFPDYVLICYFAFIKFLYPFVILLRNICALHLLGFVRRKNLLGCHACIRNWCYVIVKTAPSGTRHKTQMIFTLDIQIWQWPSFIKINKERWSKIQIPGTIHVRTKPNQIESNTAFPSRNNYVITSILLV